MLDAVPVNERLAGFSEGWPSDAVADPAEVTLPSGLEIRAVRPPWPVATKLDAFFDRGGSDCLSSRDLEDIVTLVDARDELVGEIGDLPVPARRDIADRVDRAPASPVASASAARSREPTMPASSTISADPEEEKTVAEEFGW